MISQWETVLREKGSGKFETRRAVTLSFVSRIYRRSGILQETDRERLLLCYQTNQAVVAGRFPLTQELSLELAALLAQVILSPQFFIQSAIHIFAQLLHHLFLPLFSHIPNCKKLFSLLILTVSTRPFLSLQT